MSLQKSYLWKVVMAFVQVVVFVVFCDPLVDNRDRTNKHENVLFTALPGSISQGCFFFFGLVFAF